MSKELRRAVFIHPALDEFRDMPEYARHRLGKEINRVQQGLDPLKWAPVKTVGTGVREVRTKRGTDIHRCLYFVDGKVYVLMAFTKKDQKIPTRILDTARQRYKDAQTLRKGHRS